MKWPANKYRECFSNLKKSKSKTNFNYLLNNCCVSIFSFIKICYFLSDLKNRIKLTKKKLFFQQSAEGHLEKSQITLLDKTNQSEIALLIIVSTVYWKRKQKKSLHFFHKTRYVLIYAIINMFNSYTLHQRQTAKDSVYCSIMCCGIFVYYKMTTMKILCHMTIELILRALETWLKKETNTKHLITSS